MFVRHIGAVVLMITLPILRDAPAAPALELVLRTSEFPAVFLVAPIETIFTPVADEPSSDAMPVAALEIPIGAVVPDFFVAAVLLVRPVLTIEVLVADETPLDARVVPAFEFVVAAFGFPLAVVFVLAEFAVFAAVAPEVVGDADVGFLAVERGEVAGAGFVAGAVVGFQLEA